MAREKVTRSQAGRAIFLTGFMAAGKTTVGRLLAEQLHARFVDLDERIMEREGQSIAQIFAQAGEATFRKIETAALRDVLSSAALHKVVVIALGGGTLEKAENRKIIQGGENALVLLDAPVDELY